MSVLIHRPILAVALPPRKKRAGRHSTASGLTESPLDPRQARRFRELFLPHLDAAYAFARFLTRDAAAAEDLTQDAFLAACRAFGDYRGGQPKAWLFAILRSTFLMGVRRSGSRPRTADVDEAEALADPADSPEAQLLRADNATAVRSAIEMLPEAFREVIVLRELQELSYREIAEVTGAPIGTVMSRLARARAMLARSLGVEGYP